MDTGAVTPAQARALLERYPLEAICQALRPHMTSDRAARIEQVLQQRLTRLTVVVENLHDPHNGAAAIRSAEAVGLQAFHAVEATEPFEAARGITMSCDQWMDLRRHPSVDACYVALREAGFSIWAAAPGGDVALAELSVERPMALVFGNERHGLTEEAQARADGTFVIPMHGFTGSFNLSVSVALAVYLQASRMREALGREGDLEPARLEWLRALWYCLSVRAAGMILDHAFG